jgi:REP element-mobilizing transposase RayT
MLVTGGQSQTKNGRVGKCKTTAKVATETVPKKNNFKILESNEGADHVHTAIEYPPTLSISQIVNHLKGVSSRLYGAAGDKKILQNLPLESLKPFYWKSPP